LEPHVRSKRFVPFHVQATALRSFLLAHSRCILNLLCRSRPVRVFVVTENAPNAHSIVDYDGTSEVMYYTNVSRFFQDVCSPANNCSVHVLSEPRVSSLQAFSTMCTSQILLPTASGFSHLAAHTLFAFHHHRCSLLVSLRLVSWRKASKRHLSERGHCRL